MLFYCKKRPFVDEFIAAVGKKFEVVFFCSANEEYANKVLDVLDPKRIAAARLFKDSCDEEQGMYTKNLARLGRDLRRTVIIDNTPFAYKHFPRNAIPIKSFFNDQDDTDLRDLLPLLETLARVKDVTAVIGRILRRLDSEYGIDLASVYKEENVVSSVHHKRVIGNYEPSPTEANELRNEDYNERLRVDHSRMRKLSFRVNPF